MERMINLGTFPGAALSRAQAPATVFPLWQLFAVGITMFLPIGVGLASLGA